jgi:MFS family permease
LTLTLFGDTIVSLILTTQADRIGRRRMLVAGAILMAAAGLAFACTQYSPASVASCFRLSPGSTAEIARLRRRAA